MNKIYFDLDGVLRDLASACGHELRIYDHPTPNGQSVSQYVDERLELLIDAPCTPYIDTILALGRISIVSFQAPHWRPHTINWLNANVPEYTVQFTDSPAEKLDLLKNGAYIVEDYPKFPQEQYKNVILIDYPYNRNIDAFARVRSPKQLEIILRGLRG